MITKYIKVKANLEVVNEEGEEVNLILNRHTLLFNLRGITGCLNMHLAKYLINYNYFEASGNLVAEDLIEYVNEDDGISNNIKSIVPIYLGLDDEKGYYETGEDYFTRPINIYLYIKIEAQHEIPTTEMESLKDYLEGQLSDGWGEGFEQRSFEFWYKEDDQTDSRYKYKHLTYTGYVNFNNSHKEKYEVLDDIERHYN